MTWAEAFTVIERGGLVKREAWSGHFVMAREPERVIDAIPVGHPLHGLVNAMYYLPYLIRVDTLTGRAWPDLQYMDIVADDWHEVLT